MKILWFGFIDPGGIAKMYAHAINKYSEHECRVVAVQETRNFDSDIVFQRSMWGGFNMRPPEYWNNEFMSLVDDSDIIIVNMAVAPGASKPETRFDDASFKINDITLDKFLEKKNKKVCAFFFGSTCLRRNYQWYTRICKDRGWDIITCQPDIYRHVDFFGGKVSYVPILLTSDHNRYKNSVFDFLDDDKFTNQPLYISHSPTDRSIKNTDDFIKVVEKINSEKKYSVRPIIIENCGLYDALAMKKGSQAALDQLQINDSYYCLSSVENMTLGVLNFVSLDEYSLNLIKNDIGELPPWEIVNSQEEFYDRLIYCCENKNYLYGQMKLSYAFARNQWSDRNNIHKLIGVLEDK